MQKTRAALDAILEKEDISGLELDSRELVDGKPLLHTFVGRQDFHSVSPSSCIERCYEPRRGYRSSIY